jgi:2-hydroxychromene-2-carboxylate isomerase
MAHGQPIFHYEFSSPYAYLAAQRVDEVLPVKPAWQPVAFGFILQATGRVPWSLRSDRERQAGLDEIRRRLAERGLPELRLPEGWPRDNYSLLPLRAALVAEQEGRIEDFSSAVYDVAFAEGRRLDVLDNVLEAAERCGLEPKAVEAGVREDAIKDRLRELTDGAIARGIVGVPTVVVGEQLFWGDDRLDDAARAVAG